MEFDQALRNPLQQAVLTGVACKFDIQFLGQCHAQGNRAEGRIGDIGADEIIIQRIEQPSAQQGLAGTHLAGHFDKALAGLQCQQQDIHGLTVTAMVQEETGVRRYGEWRPFKTEMFEVH